MIIAISKGGTHFNELTLLMSEIKSSGQSLAITFPHWLGSFLLSVCVTDKLSSRMKLFWVTSEGVAYVRRKYVRKKIFYFKIPLLTDGRCGFAQAEERVVLLRCFLGGLPHSPCRGLNLSCMSQVDRCNGDEQMMCNKLAMVNTRLLRNMSDTSGQKWREDSPCLLCPVRAWHKRVGLSVCNRTVQNEPCARRLSQSTCIHFVHPFVHGYFCIKEPVKM